jgi:NADPH:quinone reductase-like Zn-dependent oxidoreductase
MATMQAVVAQRSGGPEALVLARVPRPSPRDDEVLVRVRAAGVNASDRLIRRSGLYVTALRLWRGAAVAGLELAGVVEEVGRGVPGLAPGDEVYGAFPSTLDGGSYAEFASLRQGWLARKPRALSFEEAAALPVGGVTALQVLRDLLLITVGERLLVNGASGAVGALAVQLGTARGASVTGVASARNLDLVRALGAAAALDYAGDDLAAAGPFDAVLDAAGALPEPLAARLLRPGGRYVTTTPTPGSFAKVLRLGRRGFRARVALVRPRSADLAELAALADAGALRVPLDRVFPLAEADAAQAYLETGHPRGRVVLAVP